MNGGAPRGRIERHRLDERGITLLELLMALFMGAVIMVGVMAIWRYSQEAYFQGVAQADVQQNARVGMERLVRLIQAAGTNPRNRSFAGAAANDPAFVAFRAAGSRCLRLYADLNGDGDVADLDENVDFIWDGSAGSALTQTAGGGPDVGVLDPVSNATFVAAAGPAEQLTLGVVPNAGGAPLFQFFYGRNGGPGGEPPDSPIPFPVSSCELLSDAVRSRIGRVVITLTVQDAVGSQPFTKRYVTEARPRNVP